MSQSENNSPRKINIKVPFITRLEGEGSLELTAKGDDIEKLHLRIFEPPRLFEKFLQGRSYRDVADLSARICGICPMAYQLTSIIAMEKLFDVNLPGHLVALRQLMNLGEWLQSHALHIHFLAMPDFLGYNSALDMAKDYPDLLKGGMKIQEAGNALMTLLGGRSVHPVGLQVGGFAHLPAITNWDKVRNQIEAAIPAAESLLAWSAEITLPDYAHEFTWVSLKSPEGYAMNTGDICISDGKQLQAEQYSAHFREHQVRHSTAFYSLYDGKDYLVGPLARMNNNYELLHVDARKLAEHHGLTFPARNMFASIQARALECLHALYEARTLLAMGCPAGDANVLVTVKAGECYHCTEAPRGLIYHHYQLSGDGTVQSCSIIPPTSQNQARIEQDLKYSASRFGLNNSDEQIKHFCEQVIRNYDPCISCSTHFLDCKIIRQ